MVTTNHPPLVCVSAATRAHTACSLAFPDHRVTNGDVVLVVDPLVMTRRVRIGDPVLPNAGRSNKHD